MYVPVVEDTFGQIQQVAMCFQVLQCQHGRFLHYRAQVTGQGQLSLSTAQAGFYEQNLTAYGRPGQSRHYAGIFVALVFVAGIFLCAEELFNIFRLQLMGTGKLIAGNFQCDFTHHLADFLFQLTHTAFTGIVLDDVFNGRLAELHVFLLQAVLLHLFRNEVTASDFNLLFGDVTAHFNQLHTVEQRRWDGAQVVGRSDEHDVRQVVVNVNVIVVERVVLFRVEHFQHGRARVAMAIAAQLINLIQNDDRIRCFRFDQALDDTSRHGTDVRLAVTADFGFIVHATQ